MQESRANLHPDSTYSPHYLALQAAEWILTHTDLNNVVVADEESMID